MFGSVYLLCYEDLIVDYIYVNYNFLIKTKKYKIVMKWNKIIHKIFFMINYTIKDFIVCLVSF